MLRKPLQQYHSHIAHGSKIYILIEVCILSETSFPPFVTSAFSLLGFIVGYVDFKLLGSVFVAPKFNKICKLNLHIYLFVFKMTNRRAVNFSIKLK